MKKAIIATFSVLIAVMVLGALLLAVLWRSNDEYRVDLKEDGITREELSFSVSGLKPGDTKGYEIEINAPVGGDFRFTLSFLGEPSLLGQFITVEVAHLEISERCALPALLGGEKIRFACNLNEGKTTLKVNYTLSLDAGNEVQGKVADFSIVLFAERA